MVLLAHTGLQEPPTSVLASASQMTVFLIHGCGSEDSFLVFINKFRWKIRPSFSFHLFDFVKVCIPLESLCCTCVSIRAITSLSFNVLFVEPVPEVHIFYMLTVDSALPRPNSISLVTWQSCVCLLQWYCHCLIFPCLCICVWLWFFQAQWLSKNLCLGLSKSFLFTLLPREEKVLLLLLVQSPSRWTASQLTCFFSSAFTFFGVLSTVSVPHISSRRSVGLNFSKFLLLYTLLIKLFTDADVLLQKSCKTL